MTKQGLKKAVHTSKRQVCVLYPMETRDVHEMLAFASYYPINLPGSAVRGPCATCQVLLTSHFPHPIFINFISQTLSMRITLLSSSLRSLPAIRCPPPPRRPKRCLSLWMPIFTRLPHFLQMGCTIVCRDPGAGAEAIFICMPMVFISRWKIRARLDGHRHLYRQYHSL